MSGRTETEGGIRSFIAIDISSETRKALDDYMTTLKPFGSDVKWVRGDAMHLTLKFLGDVKPAQITKIRAVMESAVKGIAPFEIAIEGAGAFPNLKRPRVIWTGVIETTGSAAKLAGLIEDGLKPLGFKPEDREFKPHLTLGRVREGGRIAALIEKIKDEKRRFGSFTVNEINLMRSDLKPTGAVYTRLESVTLRG